MALMMTGMVPYQKLGWPIRWRWGSTDRDRLVVGTGKVCGASLAGLTMVIFVFLFGQARILFSIAHDGLLPSFFGTAHPRFFRTPFYSQALIGAVVALIAASFPIGLPGEMVSIGTLLAFLLMPCGHAFASQ